MASSARNHNEFFSKEDILPRKENIFAMQLVFFRLMGQLSPAFESLTSCKVLGAVLNVSYRLFNFVMVLHLALLFAKTTYDHFARKDIVAFCDTMIVTVIYWFATFATVYWWWYEARLMRFVAFMNASYRHRSIFGLSYVTFAESYIFARKVAIIWNVSCTVGALFWGLLPIMTFRRVLPLDCWYPFDTSPPFIYETVYFLQLLAQVQIALMFANGSTLYVSSVMNICGQYDILFASLRNLYAHSEIVTSTRVQKHSLINKQDQLYREKGVKQSLISSEYKTDLQHLPLKVTNEIQKRLQFEECIKTTFRGCIQHHKFILEANQQLESIFSPYCLVKSGQIIVLLCMQAFIAVVGDNRSIARISSLLQYICLTISELFLFTYFGEVLRQRSLCAGEALMQAPWQEYPRLLKQEFLIFLTVASRPAILTAGKMYAMNIDSFRTFLASSFSFLTLLRKLVNKN